METPIRPVCQYPFSGVSLLWKGARSVRSSTANGHRRGVVGGRLGVVAGPGQGAGLDVADAEVLADADPLGEAGRLDPARHGQVVRRRAEVLADRDDADADAGEVGE